MSSNFSQIRWMTHYSRMVPLDNQAHLTKPVMGETLHWTIKWPVGVLDRPKEPFYYQLSLPNNSITHTTVQVNWKCWDHIGCVDVMNVYSVRLWGIISTSTGVDFRVKNLDVDSHQVRLQIWDTAGQERFRSIGKGYYRGSEVGLVTA